MAQPLPTDPIAARRLARVISFALTMGPAIFAVVVATQVGTDRLDTDPRNERFHTVATIISVAMVLVASLLGARTHTFRGSIEDKTRRTMTTHLICLALSEGATFLGLVVIVLFRSWDVGLPAAIGAAGLVTSIVRGEIRFAALIREAEEGSVPGP